MLNSVRSAILVAIAAALLPCLCLGASTGGYRLAGVVAVGPDYLAILEVPDGAQVLVRQGSVVEGGGRVVLLDASRLRIAFPGRPPLEVTLDGSGSPPQVPVALGVLQEQSDNEHVMIRRVDSDAFVESVARSATLEKKSAPATRAGDPGVEAARRLSPILNLPPSSRVVAVNEQPVRSADQAIALIEQSLRDNITPRLNLAGDGGWSRVYVLPAQPEP